jgi:hypothetical protein
MDMEHVEIWTWGIDRKYAVECSDGMQYGIAKCTCIMDKQHVNGHAA